MSYIHPSIAHLCPDHGTPTDRGNADAYYDRPCRPHKYVNNVRVTLQAGSDEHNAYLRAYHAYLPRKDHGEELIETTETGDAPEELL